MNVDFRDLVPIGPFEYRWPDAIEHFDHGWQGTIVVEGRSRRFRHGIGRREAYGGLRARTVTWLDGAPVVEGVGADDHDRKATVLSRIKQASGSIARTLQDVPPGYRGVLIVKHRDEIDHPNSPTGLAVKVREDDLESWARLAVARAALSAPRSPTAPRRSTREVEIAPPDGPSVGMAALLDLETMDLERLSSFLHLYLTETNYDIDLRRLRDTVGATIDPARREHRAALLQWLRDWGMNRHLRRLDHERSDEALLRWWERWGQTLPPTGRDLTDLTPIEIDAGAIAFGRLASLPAATRTFRGEQHTKVFGPTAAAKTLFAVRPQAFLPWDAPIREALGLGENDVAYRTHLHMAARLLRGLADRAGVAVQDLPRLTGRPESSPCKLIDEYLWVRLSRRRIPG